MFPFFFKTGSYYCSYSKKDVQSFFKADSVKDLLSRNCLLILWQLIIFMAVILFSHCQDMAGIVERSFTAGVLSEMLFIVTSINSCCSIISDMRYEVGVVRYFLLIHYLVSVPAIWGWRCLGVTSTIACHVGSTVSHVDIVTAGGSDFG